jgi:hypothetical protein
VQQDCTWIPKKCHLAGNDETRRNLDSMRVSKMVAWGGIEPPTRGFSIRFHVRSGARPTRNTNKIKYLQRSGPHQNAVKRTASHPLSPGIARNCARNSECVFIVATACPGCQAHPPLIDMGTVLGASRRPASCRTGRRSQAAHLGPACQAACRWGPNRQRPAARVAATPG